MPPLLPFYYLCHINPQKIMEQLKYFYHSDHLGSSSWITDGNGYAIQHLHYLPFGEDWVDQRNTSWNAPYTFSGKEKDAETGYGYFGARYYDSGLSIWLSVDPMSDKYPSMSPYNYCANNPVILVDPDGRDWYEPIGGGDAIWREGNAATIKIGNITYNNVGPVYTKVNGKVLTYYNQNKVIGTTDLTTDIGKRYSMIAAEGGWEKDENNKTVRETQYGLYIIGASMENRLSHPKNFKNTGTYSSLFIPKQYNAANGPVYKNLEKRINQWISWYGTANVMDYLNAVYNATSSNCVEVLKNQYGFTNSNHIVGYNHNGVNSFGEYAVDLKFDYSTTLIKRVQSSTCVFKELKK